MILAYRSNSGMFKRKRTVSTTTIDLQLQNISFSSGLKTESVVIVPIIPIFCLLFTVMTRLFTDCCNCYQFLLDNLIRDTKFFSVFGQMKAATTIRICYVNIVPLTTTSLGRRRGLSREIVFFSSNCREVRKLKGRGILWAEKIPLKKGLQGLP